MKTSLRNWMLFSGAVVATSGMANAQAPAPAQAPVQAPVQAPAPAPAQAPATGARLAADRPVGVLPGPIHSLTDLQDAGRMLFKLADTNNDDQISQKEAMDAGNLMVGGYFFRADQNGDGVLSQDEAKAARDALFAQQPLLRYIVEKSKAQAKAEPGANVATTEPAKAIGNMLDTNNDKQIQASEVRQAVTSAVQGLFAMADTNRDNSLSPTEINAAIIGVGRTAAQAAFQQADADKNGSLSRAEFDKAIVEPANMVFALLDTNNDGQVSPEEAQQAQRVIGSQLKMLVVPEPANSARNLLRTGARPDQIAPVPTTPTPRR